MSHKKFRLMYRILMAALTLGFIILPSAAMLFGIGTIPFENPVLDAVEDKIDMVYEGLSWVLPSATDVFDVASLYGAGMIIGTVAMEKPLVYNNGELLQQKTKLKGKTKQVYDYLQANAGLHGVREMQRKLDYSSPSVVVYHLNNLIEKDLVKKTDEGKYYVTLEAEDLITPQTHLKMGSIVIPKSTMQGALMAFMVMVASFFAIMGISSTLAWSLLVIPTGSAVALSRIKDSIREHRKINRI